MAVDEPTPDVSVLAEVGEEGDFDNDDAGYSTTDGHLNGDDEHSDKKQNRDKKRRAFKACAHCRQRKAKCDLGDLNSPREPPCARCLREGISCTFLPSRRGGRVPFAARKAAEEASAGSRAGSTTAEDHNPNLISPKIEENPTTAIAVSSAAHQTTGIAPLRTFSLPSTVNIDTGPSLSTSFSPSLLTTRLSTIPEFPQSALTFPYRATENSDTSAPFSALPRIESQSAMMPWHTSPANQQQQQLLNSAGNPSPPLNTSQSLGSMSDNRQSQSFAGVFSTGDATTLFNTSPMQNQAPQQQQQQQQQQHSFQQPSQQQPYQQQLDQMMQQYHPSFSQPQQQKQPQQQLSQQQQSQAGRQSQSRPQQNKRKASSPKASGSQPRRVASGISASGTPISSMSTSLPGQSHTSAISNSNQSGTAPHTSIVSPSGDSHSSYDSSHRKHKHRHGNADENRIVDPDELASAKLRNPVDALNLLVLAADSRKEKGQSGTTPEGYGDGENATMREGDEPNKTKNGVRFRSASASSAAPFVLADFPLVQRGVISTLELIYFVNLFFAKIHHIFPIVPQHRIPTTEAELTAFARDELHLTTVFILIASRLDQGGQRQMQIHDKTWTYMRELINELVFGKDASVGAVEALLLLSENPPRELAGVGSHKDDYAEENRMSWMIVGTAVRLGYMLALDQTSIYPSTPNLPQSAEGKAAMEKQDRERIAWTYCYLFDRQVSIRTGKAFWSRGPGLCFTGFGPESFPSMRAIPGMQDDFASLISAYVEVTQVMSNAHDILYPSKDRTIALVRVGEYYKYIDEFTRTLNNFRYTWEAKKWEIFPLTECVWITFHYVRLYIYAFAFQAHLQRVTDDSSGSSHAVPAKVLFPRGPMGSPDAKFILEAIDAAADLLRICVDRLHPQGVLQYLPWRFFLFFAYAGVFLLKAVFINAVAPLDRKTIVRLLKRLIVCLACASKDEHHHAVRYARLLNTLLRTFSRGRDGVGTGAGTPTKHSPLESPIPMHDDTWPVSRPASPVARTKEAPAPTSTLNKNVFLGLSGSNQLSSSEGYLNENSVPPLFDFGSLQPPLSGGQLLADSFIGNTAQEERTAADLLADFDLDLDIKFPPVESANVPLDAYNNLLDDTTLSFWAALSNNQGDWGANNNVGGMSGF